MVEHEPVYAELSFNGAAPSLEIRYLQIESHLSQPFKLKVSFAAKAALDVFTGYLFQPCTLSLSSADYPARYFHGVLTEVILNHQNPYGAYVYELVIEAPLALYHDQSYQHLFNGVSALELARQILWGRAFNISPLLFQPYELQVLGDREYPPLYRILMRDESILAFFQRFISYEGLAYYFDHQQPKSPLVLSDAIAHFAELIPISYTPNAPHGLNLKPYAASFDLTANYGLAAEVLSSGAPRMEPNMRLEACTAILPEAPVTTRYHLNNHEDQDRETKLRAEIAGLAWQGRVETAVFKGGGLILAGTKVRLDPAFAAETPEWLVRASKIELQFDEHDPYRLASSATTVELQDARVRYQAFPDFGMHASLMTGVAMGTPDTDQGTNLISVNEAGHYHARLPESISTNLEAKNMHLFDLRMLSPMHSHDHQSHMTVPTDSEALVLWSQGFSGEPIVLGTLNNTTNAHPTTEHNPQNAYWQDHDTNKLGFINEGSFIPYQSTGRKAASIIEVPSYDPQGRQSYVRLGDAISQDAKYPSQAAEPGLFLHTAGNYHEEHQGGLLSLAGNLHQDMREDGFIPALRHKVEVEPDLGAYHILDSTTAHLHQESLTSDTVTETHTQTETRIEKCLQAGQNISSFNADTTENIYLNQIHEHQGDFSSQHYNQHTLNSRSKRTEVQETGAQTLEAHETHTLNLNHQRNQFKRKTEKTYINQHITRVQEHSQEIKAQYQSTSNRGQVSSNSHHLNAGEVYYGGGSFHQGGGLNIVSGTGAVAVPDILKMNQDFTSTWLDEQEALKREIVYLLDCPLNPPRLQLQVNSLNPETIIPNTPFHYPLSKEQKRHQIELLAPIPESKPLTITEHQAIRTLAVQNSQHSLYPDAYPDTSTIGFNSKGQLPIYRGIREIDGRVNLDVPGANSIGTHIFIAARREEYGLLNFESNFNILTLAYTEEAKWLANKLSSMLQSQSREMLSDISSNLMSLAKKDSRAFLRALLKNGMVKTIKTSWGVILAFGINAADKAAPFGMFIDNPGIAIWSRIYNWSKALTPVEAAAYAQEAEAIKGTAMDIPVLDILLVNAIDVVKGILEHDNPAEIMLEMLEDTGNAVITSFLVFAFWAAFGSEKIMVNVFLKDIYTGMKILRSNIVLSWIGKTILGNIFSSFLSTEIRGIKNAVDWSELFAKLNNFMKIFDHPEHINWIEKYTEAEEAKSSQVGALAALGE